MFIWQIITINLVKSVIWVLRLAGRHGTALPGLMAETMYPGLLKQLAGRVPNGIVLVTGTNGKTTTAKILRKLLENRGGRVLANRSGSNFTRGILASLIEHTDWRGRIDYDWGIIEVDEAYCRLVARQIKPRCIVVLNVMRDQLDRYGEIDTTAKMIGEALTYAEGAVLNADDPPVAKLAKQLPNPDSCTFYGVDDQLKDQLPSDEELLAGPGRTEAKSPAASLILRDYQSESDNLMTVGWNRQTADVRLRFDGIHNAQNALAALAALKHLAGGLKPTDFATLESIEPAFGRGETVTIHGVKTKLALVKNPSGFNQNIRAFAGDPKIGSILILINDKYADSRDVSWLWDVNLAPVKRSDVKFIAGGIRAYDLALRLKYEDIPTASINTSIKLSLISAIDATGPGKELLILPTYTAMLEVRRLLSRSVELEKIWQ